MTLMIIGVIASLTIPGLVSSTEKKELETGFKKAYTSVSGGLERMEMVKGPYRRSYYPDGTFGPEFAKYFNLAKFCGHRGEGCSGYSSEYELDNYKTYSKKRKITSTLLDDWQFVTADGMQLLFENNGVLTSPIMISVDVNGPQKKPNAWGHDLFTFQLMDDGSILPMGSAGTQFTDMNTYCSDTSTDAVNGISCAYKAMTDEDYWKNLP